MACLSHTHLRHFSILNPHAMNYSLFHSHSESSCQHLSFDLRHRHCLVSFFAYIHDWLLKTMAGIQPTCSVSERISTPSSNLLWRVGGNPGTILGSTTGKSSVVPVESLSLTEQGTGQSEWMNEGERKKQPWFCVQVASKITEVKCKVGLTVVCVWHVAKKQMDLNAQYFPRQHHWQDYHSAGQTRTSLPVSFVIGKPW